MVHLAAMPCTNANGFADTHSSKRNEFPLQQDGAQLSQLAWSHRSGAR